MWEQIVSAGMGIAMTFVGAGTSIVNNQQAMAMQRQQLAATQAAQTPPDAACPPGWQHSVIVHADPNLSPTTPGPCERVR